MVNKKKHKEQVDVYKLLDIGTVILSLWFVYSVVQNARSMLDLGMKNAPASYAFILSTVLIAFISYKNKKLSIWSIIALTALATSGVIWLFGLSTRSLY